MRCSRRKGDELRPLQRPDERLVGGDVDHVGPVPVGDLATATIELGQELHVIGQPKASHEAVLDPGRFVGRVVQYRGHQSAKPSASHACRCSLSHHVA
jgi:hypothetical protein